MWIKYNVNPVGRWDAIDCAVRALTKALNVDWERAYMMLAVNGLLMGSRGVSYNDDTSYARGRRNARRDSMGRYSRRGYSMGKDEYIDRLREAMESAPDEMHRQKVQHMIQELESM